MNIKKIVCLLLAISLLFAMTGCNTNGNTDTTSDNVDSGTTAPATEEPVILTLQADKDAPIEGLEAVIAAIERDLNIKTEIEIRVGGSEGDNIIKTRLASGDMTDLYLHNSGALLQSINPAEYVLDITDQAFTQTMIDDFVSAVTVDGKIYGIPMFSTQAGAWLYNKRVYEELNLSVPQTWDELMANCQIVKDSGKTAIIASFKDDWTSQLVLLADYYNLQQSVPNFAEDFTNNKAKYATTSAAGRSFEKLAETNQYFNEDYLATTYDVALDMLANQEGAHYPMLTQGLSSVYQLYPDQVDDIGVFAQPGDTGAPGLTVWMPTAIYGNKNSDKQDAILKWMEYYVSQAGIDAYGAAIKPNGPYAVKNIELPDDVYGGVKDMQAYFDSGQTTLALEFLSPVKGSNSPQICVSVGAKLITPEEAAAQYDQDVEKQATQLNLPGW